MKKRVILLMLSFLLTVAGSFLPAAADPAGDGTYEVVLMIDVSGSMNQADPDRICIQAAKAFAYYHPSQAKYFNVSIVLYNTEVTTAVKSANVVTESGMNTYQTCLTEVAELENAASYQGLSCWNNGTDIGAALKQSQQILDASKASQKAAILFTDGKIDLDGNFGVTTEDEIRSVRDSDEVAKAFSSKQIPIYTVGLNRNGSVDREFLQNLADMTGGECLICSSAEDLVAFFQAMYAYFVGGTVGTGTTIQTQGKVVSSHRVNIYGQAISEANLVLFSTSEIETFKITNPSGTVVAQRLADGSTSSAEGCVLNYNRYTVNIKLLKPSDGYWNIEFTSAASGTVQIGEIYLYNLNVESDAPAKAVVGETIDLAAALFNADTNSRITTAAIYESSACTVTVRSDQRNDIYSAKLNAAKNGYTLSIPFANPGSYEILYRIDNDQFSVETAGAIEVVQPVLSLSAAQTTVQVGETVAFTAQFLHPQTSKPMPIPDYLTGFRLSAQATCGEKALEAVDVKYELRDNGEIVFSYTPQESGSYTLSVTLTCFDVTLTAESTAFTAWKPDIKLSASGTEFSIESGKIPVKLHFLGADGTETDGYPAHMADYALTFTVNGKLMSSTALAEFMASGGQFLYSPTSAGAQTVTAVLEGGGEKLEKTLKLTVKPSTLTLKGDALPDVKQSTLAGEIVCELDLSTYFTDSDGDALTFLASADNGEITAQVTGTVLTLRIPSGQSGNVTVTVSDGKGAQLEEQFAVEVGSLMPVLIGVIVTVVIAAAAVPIVLLILKKRRIIRIRYRIKLVKNSEYAVYEIGKASSNSRAKPLMTVREILDIPSLTRYIDGDLSELDRSELIREYGSGVCLTGFAFKDGFKVLYDGGKEKVYSGLKFSIVLKATDDSGDRIEIWFGKTTDFKDEDY